WHVADDVSGNTPAVSKRGVGPAVMAEQARDPLRGPREMPARLFHADLLRAVDQLHERDRERRHDLATESEYGIADVGHPVGDRTRHHVEAALAHLAQCLLQLHAIDHGAPRAL